MYRHLLVPLDDHDLAIETVGKAANLAHTLGARISFVHVRDAGAAPVDAAIDTRRERARASLAMAEAVARAWGVPCAGTTLDAGAAPAAILATARNAGCDLIFMAPPGDTVAGVLAAGELPVLVTAAHPAGTPHPLVENLRHEHRTLAAVLHAWLHLLNRDTAPDAAEMELMQAMARYVNEFPPTLHRPAERDLLFGMLRGRTAVVNAELDELKRQHGRERALAVALATQAARGAQPPAPLGPLRAAVDSYAQCMWEHMGRVEGVILPVARRCLHESDWDKIHAAATRLGGAYATGEATAAGRQLLSRMAHTAPP